MNSSNTRFVYSRLFWESVSLLIHGSLAWLAWEMASSEGWPRTALEAWVVLGTVIGVSALLWERKTGFVPSVLRGNMPIGLETYALNELMYICVYFFGLGYFWALVYGLGLCFRIDVLQRYVVFPESQLSRLFQGHN